jgi:Kef-type K+ transport system membrane component KefB
MEILYILLVILVVTRLAGELATRVGQPALVGELVGGILLGVVVHRFDAAFPILSELSSNPAFLGVTDLGVFFLMLLAGLEMHPRGIAEASRGAIAVALGGLVVPFAAGWALGAIWIPESDWKTTQVMFLATSLAITAIPVAVKVLIDLGQLDSMPGRIIVSAAVLDDVFGLILLGILTALIETGQLPTAAGLLAILGRVALFFGICTVLGHWVLPRLAHLVKTLWIEEMEFSFLLIVALGFCVLAEVFGLHFIVGAFLAGLFYTQRTIGPRLFNDGRRKVSAVTSGFLAPVFFASIGYHLDLSALGAIPLFVTILVVIAMISKILGAGLMASVVGLKRREAAQVGFAMSGRGAVELIIADIALRAGLFVEPQPTPPVVSHLFSAVVIMAVATTLFMPIGLRLIVRDRS